MSKSLRPGEAVRAALSTSLDRARELVRADTVDGVELGKALAAITSAVRAVYVEAGVPSMRMAAAEKALDLRTKKTELETFVGPT